MSCSQHWLDGIKRSYHVDESHPRVALVLALTQTAEAGAITAEEANEFRKEIELLQDDLIAIWNAAHPKIIQLHREEPISKFTETYWRSLISPGSDKPPIPATDSEKNCFWQRLTTADAQRIVQGFLTSTNSNL